ncbi:hypothetical protein [Blastococcus brunescens]|uniref:Uncharacterized protein n=1 Tax=Blastococcus brunescens TaxID=1564165 RepID=A0ABZ1ATL8_9ACTN|nr:hypothetical protein [Blastococcus sp. BMG 8361]WRL61918.1 hypothetical protein U6N30_17635 [Blastococcus sp. BMG 8361]
MTAPTERRAAGTAAGIATALLAGRWRRKEMVRRTAVALGLARAPRWVGTLVGEVLAAYRDAPVDRPRELAGFVRTTEGGRAGGPSSLSRGSSAGSRLPPRPSAARTGSPTSPTRRRWPGCSTWTPASWPGSPTPTGSSARCPSRCGTTGGRRSEADCSRRPSRGSRRRSGGCCGT